MKMHRSPDIWSLIITWIGEHRGELISAGLAAIMATLRGMYAGGGRTQVMLDAAMCSLIAWFIEDVLTMFGVEPGWTLILSVFIGYMGTDYIGSVLKRMVGSKTGGSNENQ
ncbi:phage holin, lambda family [Yersinia pseudotuberculosis]|uniref:Phage holin, lambda family n=2 Tax=Yersinia pseudotuberculosis TaxID=633 RepID=A0A0H3B1W2_YERPY|nr:phage holin, lambda family [Yersinia pseudotuberculosis]AYW89745.1 phage holin, lambda family [Yersinia pseudotuberculosis]